MSTNRNISLFNKKLILQAAKDSVIKLNPVTLIKNPVIFIVGIGSLLTTIIVFVGIYYGSYSSFNLQIAIWLWFHYHTRRNEVPFPVLHSLCSMTYFHTLRSQE